MNSVWLQSELVLGREYRIRERVVSGLIHTQEYGAVVSELIQTREYRESCIWIDTY